MKKMEGSSMPSLRTRTERRLEVGCFFKTPPAGGFLPLMVGQLTFPPSQAFPTHCIPSLQPAVCLLVCLTGPTTAWRGRGRGGEGWGSGAAPWLRPGLCPWSAPSADWPGAPARMGRVQGLDSPRSSSQPSPLLREAHWVLGPEFRVLGWSPGGCHGRCWGGSHLHI